MELLSPAGNLEKLKIVYQYGADAAYIGINDFSLRLKADNFYDSDYLAMEKIKGDKKLYGAFNIYFHNKDIARLNDELDIIASYPLDGFIISDIGVLPTLKKRFPDKEFHLSTQANCINKEAAKLYYNMGFNRVILGRECSLNEIKEIKDYQPELELETFVHGAMCLAYSGRCFLSKYMANRSANQGDCSHTCRWKYNLKLSSSEKIKELAQSGELVIEEELRPNHHFPIYEGENFTTILSSKDLCLIDHLEQLKAAGIDSFKIEGRMKSLYYAAVITRSYKKALDKLEGKIDPDYDSYREELFKVSHREFTTGFFFNDESVHSTTKISYLRKHIFVGDICEVQEEKSSWFKAKINLKNQIKENDKIEIIGPNILFEKLQEFYLTDENGSKIPKADHGKICYIYFKCKSIPSDGFLLRRAIYENEKPENILPAASENCECQLNGENFSNLCKKGLENLWEK